MMSNIKIALIILFTLFAILNVSAFQKGENRILNSDFENDQVGEKPMHWSFLSGG